LRYSVTERPEEAVEVINDSLPLAFEQNDAYYAGQLLKVRGDVWAQDDEFESAADAYNQAIAQFEEIKGWSMCADVHFRLAQMQSRQCESTLALRNYTDAVKRFGEANAPAKVLEVRIEMAELLTEINDPMAAISILSEALPVARFLENLLAEQKVLRRLGVAHSNRGDADVAALLFKKAAAMKARGEQDQEAALAMECLAQHNEKFGDREKAKRARARVAPVKQALGLKSEESND
jgi:tetratricopeptide (TPR) repeat protein